MHATLPLLATTDFPPLRRGALRTLQVNLGYKCNQSCLHCHVNAGPNRIEAVLAAYDARVHLLKDEARFWGYYQDIPTLHHGGDVIQLG